MPLELQQLERRVMLSITPPTSLALGAAPSPSNYTTQISLTWQNNDTSPDETGWELERSLSPQGPYAIVHTDSGTASGTTNYVDTGLTPDAVYYYQVVYLGPSNANLSRQILASSPRAATPEACRTGTSTPTNGDS